jgi:hypothetical protein
MFTQAGFRLVFRTLCAARVSRLGRSGIAIGYLVRFASGDIAWASRTQIVWPEHVHIHGYFRVPVVPYLAEELPR